VARPARDDRGLLGALVLIGLALRLPSLGNSLFGDELSTYYIVTRHGPAAIVRLLDGHSVDLTPPLYFLLAWLAERLGDSVQALRAVSLLAGLAAIVLTYLIGMRTVGRRGALIAAALVALSPFLIFYSTEARAYALVMSLAAGSTLCLLVALEDGRRRWWAAFAALSCAAMYAHYTCVFVLVAQFAWAFLRHPAARRRLTAASAAAVIGFLPWLPALVDNNGSFGTKVFAVIEPFGAGAVLRDLGRWGVGHPYLGLSVVPGALGLVAVGLGLAIALAATARRARSLASSPALLAVVLAAATPVGLALYSLLRVDTWDARNLIASWPGLALCLGGLASCGPRAARIAATGLTLAGFALGALLLLSPQRQRPDYAQAARLVLHGSGGQSAAVAIVVAPTPGPLAAMDAAFAYAGDAGRPLLRIGSPTLAATLKAPPYAFLPSTPPAVLSAEASRAPKLFVIAPGRVPLANLLRSGAVDPAAALGPSFGAGTSGRLLATVFVPLSEFLRAALPEFRPVQTRVLPGMLPLSVYVFVRRRP
jgi:hypothetical protein